MSSLLEHCHGEKTHLSRNEKEPNLFHYTFLFFRYKVIISKGKLNTNIQEHYGQIRTDWVSTWA